MRERRQERKYRIGDESWWPLSSPNPLGPYSETESKCMTLIEWAFLQSLAGSETCQERWLRQALRCASRGFIMLYSLWETWKWVFRLRTFHKLHSYSCLVPFGLSVIAICRHRNSEPYLVLNLSLSPFIGSTTVQEHINYSYEVPCLNKTES